MKTILLNGSPKTNNQSASGVLLEELRSFLPEKETALFDAQKPALDENTLHAIEQAQVLVLAFPLYVDGIPSHLLHCMEQIQDYFKNKEHSLTVYAIVNCGFYESRQNTIALEIIANWCTRCGFIWGQGAGIGGGGMMLYLQNIPSGHGPRKNISAALKTLAENITKTNTGDHLFAIPNFPRFLYKMSAEAGWRQMAKANCLKRKALFTRK